MNIGSRIKRRREELGWSQEYLSKKMGYKSISTIAKIEAGVNDINQTKILKFANVLDVSVNYLMGWEDYSPIKENNMLMAKLGKRLKNDGENTTIFQINKELSKMDERKLVVLLAFIKTMNGGGQNDDN